MGALPVKGLPASILALLALLLAGCGSGEDGTTVSEKAQFIARANAICSESWREMHKKFATYKREWNAEGKDEARLFARAVGDVYLPSILFWYDHINMLPRPRGERAQVERFLVDGLQRTVETALDRPYSFDTPAELSAHYRHSNRLVRNYGITRCIVTPSSFPS